MDKNRQIVHGRLGFSIPTGSITEKVVTPASTPNAVELTYPLQIGSGTFDTNLALTYLCQGHLFSYGDKPQGTFRFGKNERDRSYGNRYSLNNWIAIKATDWLSFSARIEGLLTSEINGLDPGQNPMMVITADTDNSGGNVLNSGLGFNLYAPSGALKNLRLGFEFGYPLFQDLNGIQLKNNETLVLGMQYAL